MDDDYSWNGGMRGTSSFRLPENEGLGKWVTIALLVAVVLHALVLIGLSRIDVILPEFVEKSPVQTKVVRMSPVDFEEPPSTRKVSKITEVPEPVPVVPPADELDMLEDLPEMEIDISPDIKKLEIPMASPAAAGELNGETLEPVKAPDFEPDLPDMGKTEDFFPRSRDSQVTVDPGARLLREHDPDAYADTLRKGAEGNADEGLLKDFSSLDAMARMDGNSLLTSKALIGSDLLFDFNSATLRESARVSLMKVALLIEKHPNLVCWVDGHTDLIGGKEANFQLSRKRAMAVKDWLVKTLELDQKSVAVRGFGKLQPLVKQGTVEEQAPNRRVEIKMRKTRPENEVTDEITPPENEPARAQVIEEDEPAPAPPQPPRAVVEPEPAPVPPTPPRAVPVE